MDIDPSVVKSRSSNRESDGKDGAPGTPGLDGKDGAPGITPEGISAIQAQIDAQSQQIEQLKALVIELSQDRNRGHGNDHDGDDDDNPGKKKNGKKSSKKGK